MILNDVKYKVYINGMLLKLPKVKGEGGPTNGSTFTSQTTLYNILNSTQMSDEEISSTTQYILSNVIGEDVVPSGNSNDFEGQLVLRNIVLSGEKENEEEIVSEANTILTNIIGE